MIPPELRGFETYIVSYSGGKDSTVTLLWALKHLPHERLRIVFADTTVEWPETYEYLDYIEGELDVTIDRIQAGDRPLPPRKDGKPRHDVMCHETSFFGLVRKRGLWPGARYRFCTTYLKRWPLRLYAAEFSNAVQIEGTRAQESPARAQYNQFERYFKNNVFGGGLEPLAVYRPVLHWTERRVWDFLRAHHILPNPTYNYATRCGCWCCIMGKPAEVLNFCRLHPDLAQRAADLEREIGHTWRERYSIGKLLALALAQMELFEIDLRFSDFRRRRQND